MTNPHTKFFYKFILREMDEFLTMYELQGCEDDIFAFVQKIVRDVHSQNRKIDEKTADEFLEWSKIQNDSISSQQEKLE